MNWLRRNWTAVLVAIAIVAAPVIAVEQSKSTAASIATKASKKEVAKAAAIIYEGNLAACERENDLARAVNSAQNRRAIVVNCRVYVPLPIDVERLPNGQAEADGDK